MQTTPRKPSSCLDFKNQGKKSAKTRKLGFLRNDCAYGGGDSRKPTKNQWEIQGSRKPSVLVGFLRQKKNCAYPLWVKVFFIFRAFYEEECWTTARPWCLLLASMWISRRTTKTTRRRFSPWWGTTGGSWTISSAWLVGQTFWRRSSASASCSSI